MDQHQIHFEVFAKRPGGGSFILEMAVEDREKALEAAKEMLEGPRFIAVKVTKETLDPETGEYQSISIFSKGEPDKPKSKVVLEDAGPPCVSPSDLYTVHARDRIGRLLEGWLVRNRATPFELLHRPDLIEKLDASGTELQHAVQKIAVPEAQARGVSVHEVMRGFQLLIQRAIDRVLTDQRKGAFPNFEKETFADACVRLSGNPERHYLVGAGIAGRIKSAASWSEKVDMLLDLAESAPTEKPGRALAFQLIEQALGEILGSRVGMADLLGADLDLGGSLAALTRLAAAGPVAALARADATVARLLPPLTGSAEPVRGGRSRATVASALARADATVARLLPPLTGSAERLAVWLDGSAFDGVRLAVGKRVLSELTSLRRLRPSDARGEIDVMRALAMALTAASGPLLPLDEVREAFIKRSETLVASDFVDAYVRDERTAVQEAHDLVWLLENVTGGANKRQALRWLMSAISSLRFETEMASTTESPSAHLARLAELYRQVARTGTDSASAEPVLQKIGDIAGRIEANAKLIASLQRAPLPLPQKLKAMLRMAAGEGAPPGPAADRARIEVLKIVRLPEGRAALNAMPEAMAQMKVVMQAMEAAA